MLGAEPKKSNEWMAMDEEDLEEALEAAALDELEEELE